MTERSTASKPGVSKRPVTNSPDYGLASDEEDERGTYGFFAQLPIKKVKSSRKSNLYEKGNSLQMKHEQITNYADLVPEKTYLIDVGSHLFTGTFERLDARGYAVFDHYSELRTYGNKFSSLGKRYIQPLHLQTYPKQKIYVMSLKSKLSENVLSHMKTFLGGRKTRRTVKRKTKRYKRK